jgi:Flp pilus assembly protein TadD
VTPLEQARAHFEAGAFGQARETALEGLASRPDDVELLRLAGRAGVELGAGDAVDQLRRVTELRPGEAEGWRDLGDALATEGRTEEANEAFRRVLELEPEDELALTALGHTAYAAGERESAVSYLEQAAEHSSGTTTAHISLVEVYRSMGQHEEALKAARRVAEAGPGNTLAALDVAELSLQVGRHDDAIEAFRRAREVDDLADHEVYALHGMIQVELERDDRARALELAREAAAIDRYGRTRQVLSFLEGPGDDDDEPPPSREDVDAALAASQAEHRRLHGEDRRPEEGDLFG